MEDFLSYYDEKIKRFSAQWHFRKLRKNPAAKKWHLIQDTYTLHKPVCSDQATIYPVKC